ncbi:MAG: alpha-(1-2)-phosphatidylinositol mannosyltransferase, partial [Alphaproteobacteria bacterium]|nr:alpha-(1-2)-phosphatidylinositol mannosyltransferase [Alphaproteobacteria bacterium]
GQTGYLVDVGDTDSTVAHAARLLEDADLRARLTSAARAGIAPYDWSRVGEMHLEQVYRPLLEAV